MKKFVLDTNVLLLDYSAMFKFEENEVHIPMVVLEELDNFKKEMDARGYNARETARYLDKLSKRGQLNKGVKLNNGGTLFVQKTKMDSALDLSNDNIIVQHALNKNAILVSRDINVRLKARAQGLIAQDHEPSEIKNVEKHKGHQIVEVSEEDYKNVNTFGLSPAHLLKQYNIDVQPNEYLQISNESSVRLCVNKKNLIKPIGEWDKILTIKAKNREQRFLLDALFDKDIKLVTIQGKAGTGKTLLAIASALDQVLEQQYSKLIVARPIQPMGKDLGYLPGDVNEKLAPWMKPIYDNIEYLFEENNNKGSIKKRSAYSLDDMMEQGILELEALTYIRGRSIPNQFIVIDEAQNLSSHEIKTILTRAGEGTKIVLTGDIHQIDSPYLDEHNNGFSYCISKFLDQHISAHITLEKGERSELAEIASEIL